MVLSSVSLDDALLPQQSIATPDAKVSAMVAEATQAIALPSSKLFGTDGIRGRVGDVLTASLARRVGFWAGQVLQQTEPNSTAVASGPIVIGQDSRNSSEMLSEALADGLTAAGLEVWNLGLCPTPAVAYLTSTSRAIGGVMVSASHNPPEDNGIKFFGATGTKLSSQLQAQIETAIRGESLWADQTLLARQAGERCHRPELVATYTQSLLDSVPQVSLRGVKIVLDLAWGAAARLAPQVFMALGAEVISLHNRPDGDRINVNCGSTHLESLKAAVQEHQADMGFAFDGDADRVLAVDAQGRVVDGDYILYFWGQALHRAHQLPHDTIVATVMSNLGFERAWEKQGGTLIRTAVGDQYVHAEMVQRNCVLGGEQSGHILCHHYSVSGDGILTALHLAALVQQSNTSLAELMDQSFQPYPQLLRNVRVEDRDRRLNWQTCDPLQQAIAHAEAAMGTQGRILVRASGTEPLIRVMVEAASADLTQHWCDTLVKAVQRHLVMG